MISILVPVFNVDATELVRTLHSQLATLKSGGELLVIDDGSAPNFRSLNQAIKTIPGVQYIELEQNIGRLEVRKLLAAKAKHEWLLFLDSDSVVLQSNFLENYIQSFSKGYDVVVGGRMYHQQRPADCALMLHWKYGSKRENAVRHKTAFMTNNFCIKKTYFQKLRFDLPWQGYGHEDTWIGIQLAELNARTGYIENVVLHNGIERSDVFLKKSDQALSNLRMLASRYDAATLGKHVRLFRMYTLSKKVRADTFIIKLYQLFQKSIVTNLTSSRPALWLFDFHRLSHFMLSDQPRARQVKPFTE